MFIGDRRAVRSKVSLYGKILASGEVLLPGRFFHQNYYISIGELRRNPNRGVEKAVYWAEVMTFTEEEWDGLSAADQEYWLKNRRDNY